LHPKPDNVKKHNPFILPVTLLNIFSAGLNRVFDFSLTGLPMLDFNMEKREIDHLL
jgi:hypothetical protein